MPDLFEGFKWREVLAVVAALVFFVAIMIDTVRDLDAFYTEENRILRNRIRALEIKITAHECAINPEICRVMHRETQ